MRNNVRTTIKFSLGKTVQLVFMSHCFHRFLLRRRRSSSHYGTVIQQCFVQNRMAICRSVSVRNAEYYYNVQPHLASSFRTPAGITNSAILWSMNAFSPISSRLSGKVTEEKAVH